MDAADPLLLTWTKAADNPVAWADPARPCSFPGRVWRGPARPGQPQHWSMVGTGARIAPDPTTMAGWFRYETTDPTLHGCTGFDINLNPPLLARVPNAMSPAPWHVVHYSCCSICRADTAHFRRCCDPML